jgi:hypothetical protein
MKMAVVKVLQATSWCFIFKQSLIASLGLQVISSRKFEPAKDHQSARYSENELESHETFEHCCYKLV